MDDTRVGLRQAVVQYVNRFDGAEDRSQLLTFVIPFIWHAFGSRTIQQTIYYSDMSCRVFPAFCNVTPCRILFLYFLWLWSPARAMTSSSTKFLDHTQRRATVGRTPLDEWPARHRDLYLTTHNTPYRIKRFCLKQLMTPCVGWRS
jgi:hypothetical protein